MMPLGRADHPPFYKPWIGNNAVSRSGQVRWHVMGESHYISDGPDAYRNDAELTHHVVKDWALATNGGSAFFTRVAAVIDNCDPALVDRAAVWQRIAYSNYIQEPMSGPRIAPTAAQTAAAERCFFGQLALTRPEILVVLGNRLWQELPADAGCPIPEFDCDFDGTGSKIDDAWLYPHIVDGELICTLAIKIVHPSAGYGRWNWQIAAKRPQTAMLCHSNILEHFYTRPDWPPTSPPTAN